ncbi:hypothetical protein BDY19DRAFT_953556 [Irpex rosettiformis]|uniref:Uncharacterized protein n=1 Tax=Irpex rosettiformis TaxID=378272 RepID=A0ACB8U0P8_9APHY|nr:hypothetical protein BDY19DRAFT_953556 [Irpex rosettiformis]
MATAQERSEELLSVGHQCSHSTCNLVDFLPFKCQHCEQQFCGEHFLPQAHKCEKYDQSKYDRVAPSCPLCNEPVSIPPGQDPNLGMERHFSTECSVMTGKIKKSSVPRCAKAKCGKLLFSPIQCAGCKQQYCPSHRFPKDHTCASLTNANTTGSGSRPKQSAAAGAAALAALKRAVPSAKPPSATESRTTAPAASSAKPKLTAPALKIPTPSTSSSSSNNKTNTHNPFSKTDRRAKAERESRLKAMQARAQKGLLSDEEKAILDAELEEAGKKKDDCVIA